ncbi:YgiQ family radical SAM protein [Methanospirillum sp.]|uniref:YgiQ family radical SAM protein n=1 Tax=Methanospirillum sp. TaxID=45200 RepID=UPI002C370910|nr:YgiQ family radical SAM protein [Methanospirillum sp.]HPP78660.1 YgiQ family radical SAM protein [Methanospirillum sp.]
MIHPEQPRFLPISQEELRTLGIIQPDIIIISGDAYVDHPSFAAALLGRVLWDAGFSVGIIPQPDPKNPETFRVLGKPRLFFAISGGSVDSMVSNYTAAQKRRSDDAYSPGGIPKRPDRAVLVYTDLVHRLFPETPIIIGGIEASLRRFAHYDYWSDSVRQSVLADAPADLLVFGMGETTLCTIAKRAESGIHPRNMHDIPGTVWKIPPKQVQKLDMEHICILPSFAEVRDNPDDFCHAHIIITGNQNPYTGRPLLQRHPKTVIIQNPPSYPLHPHEMDRIYDLPYRREKHPSYEKDIPALEPVRFSVIAHRGCYGNCNFCALSLHQGTIIQSRSRASILREIASFRKIRGFSGIVSDVGGPSANMYGDSCPAWEKNGACTDRECITCSSVRSGIHGYLDLLDEAEKIPGVKHVFIGSGLRYDLIPHDKEVIKRMVRHISGQMKVAPEHITQMVTTMMNKPDGSDFEQFRVLFEEVQEGKKPRQYLIPYLMSGHPGCTIGDMIILAEYLRDTGLYTKQVQDFTPTPMTTSTCMYATGLDPKTRSPVHIPKGAEKRIQRAILHWRDPAHQSLVREGLIQAGRKDLIGTTSRCLIPERKRGEIMENRKRNQYSSKRPPGSLSHN